LHPKCPAQGLVVVGFSANDFGNQEPGDAKAIAQTCFNVHRVRFPMFSKVASSYVALAKATGRAPNWNFHERRSQAAPNYPSNVAPEDKRLTAAIGRLLAQR
jgi:glutathione peroxidase